MVSHQTDSLVRVWSYYKNTNRYISMWGGVPRSYCKERMEVQRGHINLHLDKTQHTQVLTDFRLRWISEEGCTIASLSFGKAAKLAGL